MKHLYLLSIATLCCIPLLISCNSTSDDEEKPETEDYSLVEGNFVDPSLISDNGALILFYLPGIIGANPAGCTEYPCTKTIKSATTSLSDDMLYVVDGNRAEMEVTSGTFSDPDIVRKSDGTYLLYVSEGQSVRVYSADSLNATFSEEGMASTQQGGVPCGIELSDNEFALYVTTGGSIMRATSSDGIAFENFSAITIHDESEEREYADPSIIPWPWSETECTSLTQHYDYLFTYHYCDSGDCTQPTNHMVGLAGSDNGVDFYPLEEFEAFAGSVPDIIFHDDALVLMHTANAQSNWHTFNACLEMQEQGYAYLYE